MRDTCRTSYSVYPGCCNVCCVGVFYVHVQTFLFFFHRLSDVEIFYLKHPFVDTLNVNLLGLNKMNKIDQPIQFEKPKGLKNDLLKIQHHYKQLEEYITAFDAHIEDRRDQFAERIKQRQLTARQLFEDAVRRARGTRHPNDGPY